MSTNTKSVTKSNRRTKVSVNPKRWAAFVAAGAAASFCGQAAEAEITVANPGVDLFDLDPTTFSFTAVIPLVGGPTMEFTHAYYVPTVIRNLTVKHSANFQAAGFTYTPYSSIPYPYAYNLNSGENVSTLNFLPTGNFNAVTLNTEFNNDEFSYQNGGWLNGGDGYMAFQFDVGNGTQYGWALLSVQIAGGFQGYRLETVAWADAGESIFAGQTSSAVPEPGTLAFLALGAVGLVGWRRRRSSNAD